MNDDQLDEHIESALRAQAATITNLPPLDRLGRGEALHAPRPRWRAPVLAAAVVAVLVGGSLLGFALTGNGRRSAPAGPSAATATTPTPTVTNTATPPSSSSIPTSIPTTSPTTSPTATPVVGGAPLAYPNGAVGLWPFATKAQADQWRAAYRDHGADPWHVDADATALQFATAFLGFKEMTSITSHTGTATVMKIGVGYINPAGGAATAAVVTLMHAGTDPDAIGWEAVAATSDAITITSPADGHTTDPGTVDGTITGVDESIHVTMRAVGTGTVLADSCCQPAGGQSTGWGIALSLAKPIPSGPLAIVASTGGHVQAVERFAVIGVIVD